jgi:hypothetical protein
MVHEKLKKWANADLSKVPNLDEVERDLADAERDIDYVKQRLPSRIREVFDQVSVDKKILDKLKEKVAAEKARRQRKRQPP